LVIHGWDFFKNLHKSTLAFKGRGETQKTINFGGKLSFILSVLFPEHLQCPLHIFSLLLPIITLQPCALNAEFQHFILRFTKISLLCEYHWKKGKGVTGGPKTGWSHCDIYCSKLQTHFHTICSLCFIQSILYRPFFLQIMNLLLITPTAFLLVKEIKLSCGICNHKLLENFAANLLGCIHMNSKGTLNCGLPYLITQLLKGKWVTNLLLLLWAHNFIIVHSHEL
jgi:hypothetical protein